MVTIDRWHEIIGDPTYADAIPGGIIPLHPGGFVGIGILNMESPHLADLSKSIQEMSPGWHCRNLGTTQNTPMLVIVFAHTQTLS